MIIRMASYHKVRHFGKKKIKNITKKGVKYLRIWLIIIIFANNSDINITIMNILNFSQCFPDEEACIVHFKAQREQNGVVCYKLWQQRTLLAQEQVELRMQTLPQSSIVTCGNSDGTFKIAISLLVCCKALTDKHEKIIFCIWNAASVRS